MAEESKQVRVAMWRMSEFGDFGGFPVAIASLALMLSFAAISAQIN